MNTNPYGIEINLNNFTAKIKGERIPLTPTEFKILNTLVIHHDDVVLRNDLEKTVFEERVLTKRNLDVHIHHLRQKVRKFGLTVSNSRGRGYRLDWFTEKKTTFETSKEL